MVWIIWFDTGLQLRMVWITWFYTGLQLRMVWIIWFDTGLQLMMIRIIWFYTGLLVEDGMDHIVLILYRSFSWGWFGSYGLIQVCIVRCGMDHIFLYWSVFLGCVTWTCIAHNNDTNAKKILPLLYPVRSICIPGISRLQRSTSENVGGLELCQS